MNEPEVELDKIIEGITVTLKSSEFTDNNGITTTRAFGYQEPPRVDLELPVDVVEYYRVFPHPPISDELREDFEINGITEPIRIYTDGQRGVLRDGRHRLRWAQQARIPTLTAQIVPNFLGKVYQDYTLPLLEGTLSSWLTENLDYSHTDHRMLRVSVDKRITKVSCSCGQDWKESPYEPWGLVFGAHRKEG